MKSETELVAAAHESFLASFGKLAEHCPEGAIRVDDGVFAFVTGLPIAFFNGCVVTEPSSAANSRPHWAGCETGDSPIRSGSPSRCCPSSGRSPRGAASHASPSCFPE